MFTLFYFVPTPFALHLDVTSQDTPAQIQRRQLEFKFDTKKSTFMDEQR